MRAPSRALSRRDAGGRWVIVWMFGLGERRDGRLMLLVTAFTDAVAWIPH
jgi:hypothetical protein